MSTVAVAVGMDIRVRAVPAPPSVIRYTGRVEVASGRGRRIRRHELTVQQAEGLVQMLQLAIERARRGA